MIEPEEVDHHRLLIEVEAVKDRLNDGDITHALIGERQITMAEDVKEIKGTVASLSKTMVGLLISLLLIGVAAILTFVLAAGVG